eukprot:274288-Rhodomonas_salina.1
MRFASGAIPSGLCGKGIWSHYSLYNEEIEYENEFFHDLSASIGSVIYGRHAPNHPPPPPLFCRVVDTMPVHPTDADTSNLRVMGTPLTFVAVTLLACIVAFPWRVWVGAEKDRACWRADYV